MNTKILLKLFLIACLGLVYNISKSNLNGKFNGGTTCSTCHGNSNSATTVAITGLPTTYVKGTTYPLTLTVTHPTNPKAGFNIAASAGVFVAGTGSRISAGGVEITHSTPKAAVGNVTTFAFTWTSPASGATVTFNAVGNSVNGNGGDGAGDVWNGISLSLSASTVGIATNRNESQIKCFPNPTTKFVTLEGENIENVVIFNLAGEQMNVEYASSNNLNTLNCENLPVGTYIIKANISGKTVVSSFIKN